MESRVCSSITRPGGNIPSFMRPWPELCAEGLLAGKRRCCTNQAEAPQPVCRSTDSGREVPQHCNNKAQGTLCAPGMCLSMGTMFSSSSLSHLLQIITFCRVHKSSETPTQILARRVAPSDLKGGLRSVRAGNLSPES